MLKVLDHEFHELIVIEVAGRCDNNVAGGEAVRIGFEYRIALETLDGFFGAQDRLTQRMVLPEILGKDFVDEIIRVVLVHFDLFENHAAFASDIAGIECRVKNQIGKNFERHGNIFIENFDVEADAFFGSEGIHVSTDGIDLPSNLFGGTMLGAFENHVFNEMGDAVCLRALIPRTGFKPDADGGGANVLHLFGDDGK